MWCVLVLSQLWSVPHWHSHSQRQRAINTGLNLIRCLWVSRESIALRVSISEQWWRINPPDYTGHPAEHLLFGVICQRDVQLNFDGKRIFFCVLKGMSLLWLIVFLLKFRFYSVWLSEQVVLIGVIFNHYFNLDWDYPKLTMIKYLNDDYLN